MNDFAKALFVDVLHLSPPCQVWSPVHTVPGQNDKQNFASLFACEELLKKSKPRMVTLEQTFGILHPKFSQAFNSLIQMFTFYGYSVSWQLVEFQRWGLAQSRKRLIIIAAGYVSANNRPTLHAYWPHVVLVKLYPKSPNIRMPRIQAEVSSVSLR